MSSAVLKTDINRAFSKPVLPGVLLLCSIVLTIVAWYISNSNLSEKTKGRFEYTAGNIQSAIQDRMAAYEQVLRNAVGFYNSADTVTRAEWSSFVRTLRLEQHYPGILGLGYTARLDSGQVDAFTRKIRAEGFPDFRVWPDSARAEYHSIMYLEPFTGRNLRAFGFDMYTDAKRRQAMQRARDNGEPALSEMVTLVQETSRDVQKGCLLYLPVYDRRKAQATYQDRRAALKGFVYSPFRIRDLMTGILGPVNSGLAFDVYDGPRADSNHLFYASHQAHESRQKADLSLIRVINVAGRDWTLVFTSLPGFVSAYEANQPNIIALAGILVNLLLLFTIVKIHSLGSRNRQLAEQYKAEKDRYEIVSLSTNDIIWEWELAEDRVRCNRNFEIVLGHRRPEPGFTFNAWTGHLHPDDRQRVVDKIKAFLGSGTTFWSDEHRMLRADGSCIHILDRARVIRDEEGRPLRMVGSMINITERKQAEEAQKRFNEELESTVRSRTMELQRSNEDLERFAHVASHDLKEPVRKMITSMDLIRLKHGEKLGEGIVLLDRVSKSAWRLNQMIDSILAFSMVNYEPQKAESVDLNAVLQQVREDLELIITEKDAQLKLSPLPVIEGSSVLLQQLFYNLVNNSLKFTKAGNPPRVRIESKELPGDRVEIRLSDNGIGFDDEEAQKIFQSFVRLHPKDRYEGTGLGLALCKRIVDRHGGSIEAEGRPGEGAAFVLRLPKQQQGGVI